MYIILYVNVFYLIYVNDYSMNKHSTTTTYEEDALDENDFL